MQMPKAFSAILSVLLASAPAWADSAPQVTRVGEAAASGPALSAEARDALLRRYGFTLLQPAQAPAFSLRNTDGSMRQLADYRGRWVLLNFFATWCGPCDEEMPSLQRLSTQVQSVTSVVAIATDSDDDVVAYGRERNLTFPLLYDADGSVGINYGVHAYPTTFLLDPTGRAVAVLRGARDWRATKGLFSRLGR